MRLGFILYRLIDFYELLILVECILSWFPTSGILGDFYEAIRQITEPFLGIFRRIVPEIGTSVRIDVSPMLGIAVLEVAKGFARIL